MGIREWIIPQEREFFDLLEKISKIVAEAAVVLQDLLRNFENVAMKARHIKDLEHQADEVVHAVYEELNKSFLTPIDREDIVALASRLDSTLDMIDAAANRVALFEIGSPDGAMVDLGDTIVLATEELARAVGRIRDMRHDGDEVARICVEVHRLENVADDLMNNGVAALFEGSDPIRIIKFKEILERLEEATDYAEDVADVLSDIVAKNR
jgi:predicted phosphate transport protein (TIGR00153 family)